MFDFMKDETKNFTNADIDANKTTAGLTYLIFFLPLITSNNSQFARFHANQSLLLLLASIVGSFVLGLLPLIGWLLRGIFGLVMLGLFIIGLLNGFNGKAERFPIIGEIELIH